MPFTIRLVFDQKEAKRTYVKKKNLMLQYFDKYMKYTLKSLNSSKTYVIMIWIIKIMYDIFDIYLKLRSRWHISDNLIDINIFNCF